ncbi:hypothetical protein B0T36_21630 [Nocardia donostiensis]|nr:hypothetical protein B0T36_21630 [Nocardia donostiensis]
MEEVPHMRQVKKPEVRKAEIIDAALRTFADKGYDRTTVESITRELGVAKGCFYHHFTSKEHVFTEVIAALAERICAGYLDILGDTSVSPRARLLAYIDYNYALTRAESAPAVMSALHGDQFRDMHHRVVDQVGTRLLPVLCELLAAGTGAGEFAVRDAEFTAVAILGMLRELHEHYADRPDLDLDSHRDALLELLERILDTEFTETREQP